MTRDTIKLFWRATWRYKKLLILEEIGNTVFVLTTEIVPPFIVSLIINKLTNNSIDSLTFDDFVPYIVVFLVIYVARFGATRLMMQSYIHLEPTVIRDLQDMCFSKLQQHSLAFFSDNFSGALVAKVNRLSASYQRFAETVVFDFGQLWRRYLAALVIMFFINPWIALAFFVWTIFYCWVVIHMHRKKMHVSHAAAEAQTEVTARLADIITNTLIIRAFSRSKQEANGFKELTQKQRNIRLHALILGDHIRMVKGFLLMIMNVIVLVLSIHFALEGKVSVGSIVLIQFYVSQLLSVLWNVGRFMDRVEESLADAAEMTAVLNQPHEVLDPEVPEKPHITKGTLQFEDVTFHYKESDDSQGLFEHLNITIPAGQKVGLVGPSGSGKTTLTKLVLRFMDIDEGQIRIDGQNIAHILQEDLRRNVAYVAQEPLLFHRSVYDNIAYGRPNATKAEVYAAAKIALATVFIDTLPHGYDTLVGERGVKLSGGQRQRVAIARAMLKQSPIIILDEATSSLDSVSERLITGALDQLMAERTTLVIAHRLSTIRKMDRILVLDDGHIIEDGTHQQLLKQKGMYAKLWSHQSGDFLGVE